MPQEPTRVELEAMRAHRSSRRLVQHRVLAAVVGVAAPAVLTAAYSLVDETDYRLGTGYVAAVCLVAVVAGMRAAILATVVAAAGLWLTVLPPPDGVDWRFPQTPVSLGVLAVSCAAVVAIVEQRDRQATRALVLQQRYRRLSDAGVVGVLFWDLAGPVTDANDTALEMLDYTRDDLAQRRVDWKALTPREYAAIDAQHVQEMFATGSHDPYEKEYIRKDGSRLAVLVGSAFFQDSTEHGISFIIDISRQKSLEADRAALLDAERAARAEGDRINRRLELLVQVSTALLEVVEPDDVLRRLAHGLVPDLADYASVFVADDGAELRRAVSAHAQRDDLAAQLTGRFAVPIDAPTPVAEAYRSGRIQRVGDAVAAARSAQAGETEYHAVLDQMAIQRGLVVPMRLRGQVLGVLALGVTDPDHDLTDPATELVAQDIADRAAIVYANARAYTAERTIASLLQQALLPDHRPEIVGHDLGACYVPATLARTVGGDWWDVLPLRDGRYALMVGDVTGHGVETASVMAELRHALRGLLRDGATAAHALDAASELLMATRPGAYATAFVGIYDPATAELRYCRAGHPPPLLVRGGHTLALEAAGGMLIGLDAGSREDSVVALGDRFELMVFTDGLVESRDLPYDEGIRRLEQHLRALPHDFTAQQRAERLVAEMVGTTGRDDVCLLVLSRRT